jgi:hypothetical protein
MNVANVNYVTLGSATTRAIKDLIEASPFSPQDWLINEVTMFNAKVNKKTFPRECGEQVHNALDTILGLTIALPQEDPLALPAYAGYVLFPRLILLSLPPGCNGKHAADALARRCKMFLDGQFAELIHEANESQVTRVVCRVHALTQPAQSFPLIARAAALAGCGAASKAGKLAFSYGSESDPEVAARFVAKLTRTAPHTHVAPPPSSYKTTFVPIPQRVITDTFTGMPRKTTPHRDGWTWEMFRDAASRPSIAALLGKFVELFVNGRLPKGLWNVLFPAITIPFHKLAQLERDLLSDPRLRPTTISSMLTRFSRRSLLRLNRAGLAERMLRSNQCSYGIPCGVQKVIPDCTIALQCNPTFVLGEFDLKNAHTD